jgi:hypothetical protein
LLRLWDRPSVDEGDLPWWLTWQRTLLLSVIDFGFGAIGPLSGHVGRGMLPMYVVTFSLLPLLYNVLGIGTRTYRRELVRSAAGTWPSAGFDRGSGSMIVPKRPTCRRGTAPRARLLRARSDDTEP